MKERVSKIIEKVQQQISKLSENKVISRQEIESIKANYSKLVKSVKKYTTYLEETNETLKEENEKHKVREDTLEGHSLLEVLMEVTADYIFFKDKKSRFIKTNKAHTKLLGIDDPKEAIGKTDFNFFPNADAKRFYEEEQEIMRTGIPVIAREWTVPGPKGETIWLSESKIPIYNNEDRVIGLVGVSRIITGRKTAEAALQKSELQYRTTIDWIDNALFVVDSDLKMVLYNKSFEKMIEELKLGKDLIGKNILADLPYLHDDYKERYKKVFVTGENIITQKETNIGNKEFIGEIRKIPIYDGKKISQVITIIRDITEQKHAEEQLNRQAKGLKRSNMELEQFAYIASHDLQEPLRMVSCYVKLLAKRFSEAKDINDVTNDDINEFIFFTLDGAKRMQQLINDLLEFSRVQTHGKEFKKIDSEIIIRHAIDNLHLTMSESNATVTHDSMPVIFADKSQLVQLFQNLIGNGIKYHGEAPPRIHISAKKGKRDWIFSVSDNGIGIDPEHYERIFIIFQRLHTKDEYTGTGIGLALCRRIVERHHGKIWVESVKGKGSTFYFTILRSKKKLSE